MNSNSDFDRAQIVRPTFANGPCQVFKVREVARHLVRSIGLCLVLWTVAVVGGPEDIYKERCAVCHDSPPDEKTPPRSSIELMGKTRIQHSLTSGSMAIHTDGLSADIIEDMARYLNKLDEQSIDATQRCPDRPISSDVVVSHWGSGHSEHSTPT